MTYKNIEESRTTGTPINLYAFRTGATSGYFYTDSENEILFDTGDGLGERAFKPIAIQRGKVEAKGTLDRTAMDIVMPNDTGIAQFFRAGIPSFVVTCVCFNGHATDPDSEFVAAATGRIVGSKISGGKATLTLLPIASDMRKAGLRRHYQYGCTAVLYDEETCAADINAATVTASVLAVNGTSILLPPGWNGALPLDGFRSGARFEWTTAEGALHYRTIRNIDEATGTISLNSRALDMVPGDIATIRLGCGRTLGDCATLHNNILNYRAEPYIPLETPLGAKSQFY